MKINMINKSINPIFTTVIKVRWADMDAYGHVNNAMYLRYMEEARVQMLYKMGYKINGKRCGPVIINAGYTYLIPVTYPASLTIKCYLDEPGRSSFMTYYKIYPNKQMKNPACEGYARVVWIDTKNNKSTTLPDDIRATINQQTELK